MAKFTEKQLISKLQELRQLKPSNDWVVLTKEQIFQEEKSKKLNLFFEFLFQHKPAFASLLVLAILFGLFGFVQKSVPGDTLYSLKKIAEKSQAVFISKKAQPRRDLELANKRLDDLTKIAEANQTQKLAPAIKEYQESVSQAAESLAKAEPENVKGIVEEIKKLEEKGKKIKALGIEIGNGEKLEELLYAKIVERQIEDFEGQVLSEEKQEILAEVKEDYENVNYKEALEKILLLLNQ